MIDLARPLACMAAMAVLLAGAASAQQAANTSTAVASAKWGGNVTIELEADSFRFRSDGLPNHPLANAYLVPVFSDTTTDTSLGMIGVLISGAPLFNDYENPERSIVALDDQHIQDGIGFLDTCKGHPLQLGSSYHYHASPPCVTETVDASGSHSSMIGVLLDGFPIYGPRGEGGVIVTNADLDTCGGHVGPTPEFPDGIYHYHLTTQEAPYSIDCYHGVVDASLATAMGGHGGPPDFAAAASALCVSQHALMDALGTQRPPNFEAAATTLGVTVDALRAALPPAPGQ